MVPEEEELDPDFLNSCLQLFKSVQVVKDSSLWREGDNVFACYLLEEGEMSILIKREKNQSEDPEIVYLGDHELSNYVEHTIETIIPGIMIGQLEIFTGRSHQNELRALTDCKLWKLSKADWDDFSRQNPKYATSFMKYFLLNEQERSTLLIRHLFMQ